MYRIKLQYLFELFKKRKDSLKLENIFYFYILDFLFLRKDQLLIKNFYLSRVIFLIISIINSLKVDELT